MTKQEAEQLMAKSQYIIGKQIPLKDFNNSTGKNIEVFYKAIKFLMRCSTEESQQEKCTIKVELKGKHDDVVFISLQKIIDLFPPSYFKNQ